MYSREELISLALRWKGIPGSGQTASAEDKQAIDEVLEGVMDSLARRNVYVWGDPDQTEDAAALPISALLATAAPDLGANVAGTPTVFEAENQLRELKSYTDAGDPIRALYF